VVGVVVAVVSIEEAEVDVAVVVVGVFEIGGYAVVVLGGGS